jgi:hypothetical protein
MDCAFRRGMKNRLSREKAGAGKNKALFMIA